MRDKISRYMFEVYRDHYSDMIIDNYERLKDHFNNSPKPMVFVLHVKDSEDKRRVTMFIDYLCQSDPKFPINVYIYTERYTLNPSFRLHPYVHIKLIDQTNYTDRNTYIYNDFSKNYHYSSCNVM